MIYAIEAVGAKAVKIGFTKDVITLVWRYQSIDTHCPVNIKLLGVRVDGTKVQEKAIHRQWKRLKIKGEWFKLSDDLRQAIQATFQDFEIEDDHRELALMLRSSSYGETSLLVNDSRFVSLDSRSNALDENGVYLSMHEVVGVAPEQEAALMFKEYQEQIAKAGSLAAKDGRHAHDDYWSKIAELRAEGFTFQEIGHVLQRTPNAIKKAWGRALKAEGHTFAEIATLLGDSQGAVTMAWHRDTKALKDSQ